MAIETRVDARPSHLRAWGFGLTAGGALVLGIASVLTWVTVGIADQLSVRTVSPGTDLTAGLLTLVCAVVVLVLVLVSRSVHERARRVIATVVTALGIAASVLAGWFIVAAPSYFSPVDDEQLVAALATATGRSVEDVRVALANVIEQLGGYTHVGIGPWLALAGGLLVAAGGILTLRWAVRGDTHEAADVAADSTDPSD